MALPYATGKEASDLAVLTGDFTEVPEVVVRPVRLDDIFEQVIITPATPAAVGQISAGTLIRAAAWKVRVRPSH